MDEKQIVKNIRKIRSSRKISLGRLAKLTGLTKGYVSKIENSNKAPPFSTLIRIANALNADFQSFIAGDSEVAENTNLCIVRKGEGREASRGTLYKYIHKALAPSKIGRNMEPLIVEPPLEETASFSHEGEEFVYVLDGSHEFNYDGKKYILNKGDSVYFDAILPHGGRSLGNKRAKLLVVIYSYKRMKFWNEVPIYPEVLVYGQGFIYGNLDDQSFAFFETDIHGVKAKYITGTEQLIVDGGISSKAF